MLSLGLVAPFDHGPAVAVPLRHSALHAEVHHRPVLDVQGGVSSGGAVELEVHLLLHQPPGGSANHGPDVRVDALLGLLCSVLPVLVDHL